MALQDGWVQPGYFLGGFRPNLSLLKFLVVWTIFLTDERFVDRELL